MSGSRIEQTPTKQMSFNRTLEREVKLSEIENPTYDRMYKELINSRDISEKIKFELLKRLMDSNSKEKPSGKAKKRKVSYLEDVETI